MIKAVNFVKAKMGMSAEAFREHYEKVHVPIIESLLPMIESYTRSYPDLENARMADGETSLPFDAVTIVTFASQEHYQQYLSALADPKIRSRIREDEVNFVEPQAIYRFLVDECTSYPSKNARLA